MTWTPTPGTIPALAIAHLRTLPPGTKLSTAALAEAIGHETYCFAAYLKAPRDLGMIVAERGSDVRSLFWSLPVDPDLPIGDVVYTIKCAIGEALAKNEDKNMRAAAVVDMLARGANLGKKKPKAGLGPLAGPACDPPGTELPVVAQQLPRVRAGTSPARWGFLSDGELHIQKGGNHVELERFEFEALVDFLRRTEAS